MPTVAAEPDLKVAATDRREPAVESASSVAATLGLVLSLTTVVLVTVDDRPWKDYQLQTLLFGSDLALLAVVVTAAGGLSAAVRAWRHHACALGALILGLTMVPSVLVHPSDRGAAALLRWAGAVALALSFGAARRDGRRLIIGALAAVSLTHLLVAVAERVADGTVGLGAIGEPTAYEIGGRHASTGLTVQPYVLAAWCAVAGAVLLALGQRRVGRGALPRIAGVAAFGGIGLTMSRAGLVAGVLALGALAVAAARDRVEDRKGDRASLLSVAGAAVAMGLGVLVNLSGWVARATTGGSVDAISSGRGALLRQAWELLQDNLFTGVGPGRYVIAVLERPELVELSTQSPRPVHLTPLLLVVEGGLLVVPGLLLVGLAIGRACWRGGAAAAAVALAMAPFLALDHLAWSYPQGLVLTGVWLGVLDLLAQPREDAPAPFAAPPADEPADAR